MFRLTLFAALFVGAPAGAQSMQSIQLATDLGTVLGSEQRCNLSYDQGAIAAWIDEHVEASDMGFASMLSMMTDGTTFQVQSMSRSSLTAHCRTVERTARHYGFVR